MAVEAAARGCSWNRPGSYRIDCVCSGSLETRASSEQRGHTQRGTDGMVHCRIFNLARPEMIDLLAMGAHAVSNSPACFVGAFHINHPELFTEMPVIVDEKFFQLLNEFLS